MRSKGIDETSREADGGRKRGKTVKTARPNDKEREREKLTLKR
jgi:hypothetical protein